jgi:hypothetical protein
MLRRLDDTTPHRGLLIQSRQIGDNRSARHTRRHDASPRALPRRTLDSDDHGRRHHAPPRAPKTVLLYVSAQRCRAAGSARAFHRVGDTMPRRGILVPKSHDVGKAIDSATRCLAAGFLVAKRTAVGDTTPRRWLCMPQPARARSPGRRHDASPRALGKALQLSAAPCPRRGLCTPLRADRIRQSSGRSATRRLAAGFDGPEGDPVDDDRVRLGDTTPRRGLWCRN